MPTLRGLQIAVRLADKPFVALLLSAVYPAVFLLSLNWYALRAEKMAFVILTPVVVGIIAYLLIRLAVWSLSACSGALAGSSKNAEWTTSATLLLVALACSATLFFFMYGTLQKILKTDTLMLGSFLALFGLAVWLALSRRLRYWTAVLGIMTVTSLLTWAQSLVAATMEAAAEERRLIHSPLKGVKFRNRPNIYLIVYDGYGNERLHREVFGVDNAAIYEELVARNFKVLSTYSNYWGTWDSMLSVFLADHHYYDLMVGVYDSRIGRWIMNGTNFNPVLSVLKDNGYKVQYIEATDYLVKNQGNLDYVYPDVSEPVYTGLRVFNNPLLDRMPSVKVTGAQPNTLVGYVKTMTDVLFQRLEETIRDDTPWFTYIHFPLPAHAGGPFRSLSSWEDVYRENTRKANAHMPPTIDRILAIDPDALIIIMGDHGSYRYSGAWEGANNPNDAFKVNSLDSDLMAVDYFGILMAIRSSGRCNDYIYESMTPVNLMRVIFSCLSGRRELLDSKSADISMFPHGLSGLVYVPSGIYMAVKNGTILKPWVEMETK